MVTRPSAFLAAGFNLFEWIGELLLAVFTIIMEIVYFVVKWMMYFTDIIFIYVQQLAGLNTDTTSMGAMFSKDSDMVFNMILSNSESVTKILRNLFVIVIVLLVVFSIIAIVKGQWGSLKNGPTSVVPVLKNMVKTILLLFLTPVIALMGIAATNIILKSLYNATNPTNSATISTRIFSTASGQANAYRIYAVNGQRIPITFDFSKEEEIIEAYVKGQKEVDKAFANYVTSSENAIYSTFMMFREDTFEEFKDLRVGNTTALSAYHTVFDKQISEYEDSLSQYRRILAYLEEYYVMADVIDYAINSSNPLYMKTIEQVIQSIVDLPNNAGLPIFNELVSIYGLEMYDDSLVRVGNSTATGFNTFADRDWQVLRFISEYSQVAEDGTFEGRQQIQYNHIAGTTDEVDGAVFIMSGEKTIVIDGVEHTYLYPLSNGYVANNRAPFESEYIRRKYIVVAKGIFENSTYPTAIRLSADGSEIQFYRDTVEISAIGEDDKFLNLDHVEDGSDGNIFTAIGNFFKKLFNPLSMVPELFLKEDSINQYYVKVSKEVNTLDNAKLHIGYLFSDSLTAQISGNMYGLDLSNLFRPTKLNILVLIFATVSLMRVCFIGMFGLMRRSYDLFLMILIYPTALATSPLDDGARYQKWIKKFVDKLFLTYGLILGINFVLLLFPVIESITFISAENLVSNVAASRVASILGSLNVSIDVQARLLNFTIAIMAELILFSMIEADGKGAESIISMIQRIANPNTSESIYSANAGEQMLHTAKRMAIFSGKIAATAIFKVPSQVVEMFTPDPKPSKAQQFKQEQMNKASMNQAQGEKKAQMGNLKDALAKGDVDGIKKGMEGVSKAQGDFNKAAGGGGGGGGKPGGSGGGGGGGKPAGGGGGGGGGKK